MLSSSFEGAGDGLGGGAWGGGVAVGGAAAEGEAAEAALEVAGLGTVEDDAGEARTDGLKVTDGTLDEGALLASGDGEDRAVGGGADEAGFDAAEDRAGVDEDDVEVFFGFVEQPTQRHGGEGAGVVSVGGANRKNSDVGDIGGADVFEQGAVGDGFEDAVGGIHVEPMRETGGDEVAVDQEGASAARGVAEAQGQGEAGFAVAGGGMVTAMTCGSSFVRLIWSMVRI